MISGHEVNSLVATYLRRTQEAQGVTAGSQPPTSAAPPQGSDGVTLSPQSASVTRLLQSLRSLPDVRPDRVDEVKTRLAAGNQPSSSDVARQILQRIVGDHLAAGG